MEQSCKWVQRKDFEFILVVYRHHYERSDVETSVIDRNCYCCFSTFSSAGYLLAGIASYCSTATAILQVTFANES